MTHIAPARIDAGVFILLNKLVAAGAYWDITAALETLTDGMVPINGRAIRLDSLDSIFCR